MWSLLHVQPQRRCVKFLVYTANIQEEIEKNPIAYICIPYRAHM